MFDVWSQERFRNSWQRLSRVLQRRSSESEVTVGTVPDLGSDAESLNDHSRRQVRRGREC